MFRDWPVDARDAAALGVPASRVFESVPIRSAPRASERCSGQHFDVDPHHVHAYVVGEHGDSEVLASSQALRRTAAILRDATASLGVLSPGLFRTAADIRQPCGRTQLPGVTVLSLRVRR